MASDAPQVKVAGVHAEGAEARLYDRAAESREEIAARLAGGLRVCDEAVARAMRMAFGCLRIVAEPGGAAALAAALKGLPETMHNQRVGVLVTGGNVDPAQFAAILGARSQG
jgi:threonine dehydratase